MAFSLQPLQDRVRAKLGRMAAFAEVADAVDIWEPPLVAESPAIIQLPDEIDRIVSFNKTVTREEFLNRARNQEIRHPPTVARLYRNAIIYGGAIYAKRSFSTIVDHSRRVGWFGTPERYHERVFATNIVSEKYFGHWLLDGLSLELLAENKNHEAIGLAREPWLQEPEYRALTGTTLERTGLAQVDALWVVDDRPMNASRIRRMREIRRRVRSRPPSRPSGRPVFLRRVAGVKRFLINQEQLADALAKRGFTVLTPEEEPVETLRSALHDAPLAVSVEGSALCHAIAAMPEGGTILAIQPPRRVDWIQKVWTDCAGLRLAQTVADDRGEGFTLSEDRLLRVFDLIARENGS